MDQISYLDLALRMILSFISIAVVLFFIKGIVLPKLEKRTISKEKTKISKERVNELMTYIEKGVFSGLSDKEIQEDLKQHFGQEVIVNSERTKTKKGLSAEVNIRIPIPKKKELLGTG